LKGAAHPAYRHGLRSKYLKSLPRQLAAGYKAALADPEFLSLREEAALLTTRITMLLDQLRDTPPGPDYDVVWTDLRDVVLDRTRVTAAEVRRLVLLQGMVRVEDALLFVTALLAAAKEIIQDHTTFRKLQEKMLVLLPDDGSGPARRPAVLDDGPAPATDNGRVPEPAAPAPGPAPEPEAAGPSSFSHPGGGDARTPPADPAPPTQGPTQCGLRELPPPPDEPLGEGEEWVWEDDDVEATEARQGGAG
jgi:hypothetical protein